MSVSKEKMAELQALITPAEEKSDENKVIENPEEVGNEVAFDVEPDTDSDTTDDNSDSSDSEGISDGSIKEPYTMKSLAEAIEVEQGELYAVIVPLRDGSEPISIGEMKNKLQDYITEEPKLKAQIQEQKKTINENQAGTSPAQQLTQAENQANLEIILVQNEYNSTNWKELEEDDPGQAALQRQRLNERFSYAQNALSQAQQQRQVDRSSFLADQDTKLLALIPEWKDPDKRKEDWNAMTGPLLDAGFTQNEIDATDNPVAVKLYKELLALRKEKTDSERLVQKVRKAPKTLKSRGVIPCETTTNTQKLVTKAKQSGNKHDEFDAVKALMTGNQDKT